MPKFKPTPLMRQTVIFFTYTDLFLCNMHSLQVQQQLIGLTHS